MVQQNIFDRPYMKLLAVFLTAPLGLFMSMFAGILLALPFWGLDTLQLLANLDVTNPNVTGFLKYLQVIQSIGLFIAPALFLGWLFYRKNPDLCGMRLNQRPLLVSVLLAALIIVVALPVINFLGEMNSRLVLPKALAGLENWMKSSEESAAKITEAFLMTNSVQTMLINLLVMALMPAISEELFFRGLLQRIFIDWTKNIHTGIIVTAAFFSFFHFQFYGFLPRMVLGLLLGYLFLWSRSIWIPMVAHFANNGLAVVLSFYLSNKKMSSKSLDDFGVSQDTVIFLIISIVMVGLLLLYLYKMEKHNFQAEMVRNPIE
jgi:uncharacterized protein